MMLWKKPVTAVLLILASTWCYGGATDNLWICPNPDGVDNIVSATTAPGENCQPYSIERIKSGSAPSPQPAARPEKAPSLLPATGGTLTVSSTPPAGVLPALPAPLDFSNIAYAPPIMRPVIWKNPLQNTSAYRPDATKIYLCTVNGQHKVTEARHKPDGNCTLMGAKSHDSTGLVNERIPAPGSDSSTSSLTDIVVLKPEEKVLATGSGTTATGVTTDIDSSDSEKIYLCMDEKGSQSIIQAIRPPAKNCQLMGVTGESIATSGNPGNVATAQPGTATKQPASGATQTAITTTNSEPGDIYKCYDKDGLPSFVNEKQRDQFRRCTFFSRSFANVTKTLRGQSSDKALPEERATGSRLLCSGAGEVVYNGEVHAYECATRSYDHTPGSSGGEVRLGDRYASIAAYDQDYFNTSGSCGGTITSANGRVLHLEPTKNCPEAFQIAAREIAQAVRDGLNVKVSGAFLERQRGLSAQINRIAREVGVDPYLVHAVISAESAYKSRAVSHAGAQGLMQLMPPTARRFNVSDPFHTGQNIRGGSTYLKWLLNKFNGNMQLAIAGYNAGEGNVIKYGYKIPPFIETKAYVPKVMQYYRRYRNNPALIGL